ncbi:MAG: hypothetical protein Q9218_006219 [Villophora microphyllina]
MSRSLLRSSIYSRILHNPSIYQTTRMSSSGNNPTENPSMLHGHAAYVAGAAKEAVGNYVSSDPSWKTSATETKDAAVAEMRAAKAQSESHPGKNETVGMVEEKLGSAVGCEGMVGEGKERQ